MTTTKMTFADFHKEQSEKAAAQAQKYEDLASRIGAESQRIKFAAFQLKSKSAAAKLTKSSDLLEEAAAASRELYYMLRRDAVVLDEKSGQCEAAGI